MRSLLPPNSSKMEEKIDKVLEKRITDIEIRLRSLWNPDTCPEEFLPWLAWSLSVDMWDSDWPPSKKRELIKKSRSLHLKKGTRWGLEEVLKTIYRQTELQEWMDYDGKRGFFKVEIDVDDTGISQKTLKQIDRFVVRYKNARSWLEKIRIYLAQYGEATVASCLLSGETVAVYPWEVPYLESRQKVYIAISYQALETITVYPHLY